jgi:predicted permease
MLGIPLALSQLGPEATGTIALVVLAHSPILFGVAALQSEFRAPSRSDNETPSMAPIGLAFIPMAAPIRFARVMVEVIDDLAKNPIILAILIGGALRVGDVHLPDTFDKLLGMLGQATLPCVLVAIGIALATFEIKGQRDTLMVLVALKLAVLPVLAWLLATHYFKLAPIDVNVITLFCAMPAGANAYVFATRVASGEATVSSAVALSTILSVFSIVCALMSMQT